MQFIGNVQLLFHVKMELLTAGKLESRTSCRFFLFGCVLCGGLFFLNKTKHPALLRGL